MLRTASMRSACCGAVEWLELTQPPNFRLQISWLFFQCQRFRRSWSSTIESVEAVCLPHATDGPKSRKLHLGEYVEKSARLPSEPPYKSKIPKGGFGALWHAFLPYLSSCNERWGHRRSFRKENAGKNVQRKISPPEVVPKRECR